MAHNKYVLPRCMSCGTLLSHMKDEYMELANEHGWSNAAYILMERHPEVLKKQSDGLGRECCMNHIMNYRVRDGRSYESKIIRGHD